MELVSRSERRVVNKKGMSLNKKSYRTKMSYNLFEPDAALNLAHHYIVSQFECIAWTVYKSSDRK